MHRGGLRSVVLAIVVAAAAGSLAAADPEMVRNDWQFRESLAAIRDWEAILARWDKATPRRASAPVLPIPADGEAVAWPNPFPLVLIPAEDRGLQVRMRLVDGVGGQIEVEHAGPGKKVKRSKVALGQAILGYKHPGGGGKDQWYHSYHRNFDRLASFTVKPSPLAVEVKTPLDLERGLRELPVTLGNVGSRALAVSIALELDTAAGSRLCGRQAVTLAPRARQTVRLPVELNAPGGGLLGLTIEAAGERFWIPLLTHVEDVAAVLTSIEQILSDTPDAAAAAQLAELRGRAAAWEQPGRGAAAGPPPQAASWRSLFEDASRLRDKLLLDRIRFDTLLFVKRMPYWSEQPFMDAHHLHNRPGGAIYRLSPVRPDGRVIPVVDSLGEGVYRDICLHWNARKLLFSFGNGSDKWKDKQSYHAYEVGVDGAGLRQLTHGPKNDCEPFYLPGGQVGFTSDRSEHIVMCGGNRHSPTLFVMEGDGAAVRQLSFNIFNDFTPSVLPDGRILYGRWEYNERSVTSLHNPFTMNPDGTMVQPYYGNATIRPNVVMFPRPVPGSNKVIALFTAHHGQTHGAVGLIDVRRGIDGPGPLEVLTPNVPITGEKAEDSRYGWFSDPMPLSESTWLCSYTPTVLPWLEKSWALYVADRHGNLALVYRDGAISCQEPVPLVPRPLPHVRPEAPENAGATDAEATLFLADVYRGLTGVPRGTAKRLRVIEDVPRKGVMEGGVITTSGTLIFTIKRVFGTVPIEPDGSAHFVVPANRNLYFEVLDENHREIQRMRSVVCLKPGEARGCIGCHESRNAAPPPGRALAAHRPASRPEPPPWGTEIVSYLRDVQPLVSAKCVACHAFDRAANKVILTDDLTNQFVVGYEELLPYLTVAISNRWDHPDDVLPRPPYTYGSKVSRLTRLLEAGHYGVKLSGEDWQRLLNWIDCNGVYYDRYEAEHYPNRQIFAGREREAIQKVFDRRCANCHGGDDGRHDTWWLSLNRRDVRQSRMLAAPLAAAAGGWGRCQGGVFADAADPDYRALLAALSAIGERLGRLPREDLVSLQGTEAARQAVVLPPPPPPAPFKPEVAAKDWVYLSDLAWESGRSGWSRTGDGLPRKNRDIEGNALRLGPRHFPKGIGTHAPSEIVYALDGKYARFQAVVGPPERDGSVVFQVFADDKKLFDSGVMRNRQSKAVDVPVAGVGRLRLVVTDGGDGYNGDSANWADARLQKAAEK